MKLSIAKAPIVCGIQDYSNEVCKYYSQLLCRACDSLVTLNCLQFHHMFGHYYKALSLATVEVSFTSVYWVLFFIYYCDIQYYLFALIINLTEPMPRTWDRMPVDTKTGEEERVHLVELTPGTREYNNVKDSFLKSITGHIHIVKIERVQNPGLYRVYAARKKTVKKQNPPGHPIERLLFHGTDAETCKKINDQGFNISFAGKNGKFIYLRCASSTYLHNRKMLQCLTCAVRGKIIFLQCAIPQNQGPNISTSNFCSTDGDGIQWVPFDVIMQLVCCTDSMGFVYIYITWQQKSI